jgi:nucleoside-diphosphate-sugar epimerase
MNSVADRFSGRRAFVTGGNGFIGANLVRELLRQGAHVHLLLRPQADTRRLQGMAGEIRIHHGDITDGFALAAAFDTAAPDFAFHLATARGNDPAAWARLAETSAIGALRLIDALQNNSVTRLVVAGSSLEYGPAIHPHQEMDALAPTTWHGVGKAMASLAYRQAAASMQLSINQLRLFHVYGPWEAAYRLLPTAIGAALAGQPLPLTRPGIKRDWVYVEDVVEALLAAALADRQGEVYNIGSGTETSNEEVVSIVEQVTGKLIARQPHAFLPSASDTDHRCADIGKARADLGWSPRHDLADGIAATLAWCRLNPSAWESGMGGRPQHV